tara:strand:- start:487 stop:1272 length:786 start_codon:yes stop_codon:yes gene_type:complete
MYSSFYTTSKLWISLSLVFYSFAVESQDSSISERLGKLERTLSTAGLLDLVEQLEELQQEVRVQRGEIENLQFQVKKIQSKEDFSVTPATEKLSSKPSNELATLSSVDDSDSSQNASALPLKSNSIDSETQSIAVINGEELYRAAFGLLKAGKYLEAIEGFNDYLSKNPAGDFSDNSQYWLGEAYYVLQDYSEAIQQYKRLIQQFPDSKKSSHAMLKIGYCHEKLGSKAKAVETLSELQELFPNSAAARLGRAKMEKLRSN